MVGVEGGEGCDFIGAGIFLGTETFGGSGAEVAFIGSGGCNRLGRVMVGGAEGKCRVSTKGDWSWVGWSSDFWDGIIDGFGSRFCGIRIELIAPPKDSDNRSDAVSVGNGARVSSTGGAAGGGETFFGAAAAFFVGEGVGLGVVVGIVGNDMSATSMVRKGRSLSDWNLINIDMIMMSAWSAQDNTSPQRNEDSSEEVPVGSPREIRLGDAACSMKRDI
jgi:hypothetical protein